jgi:hypothetical protein
MSNDISVANQWLDFFFFLGGGFIKLLAKKRRDI